MCVNAHGFSLPAVLCAITMSAAWCSPGFAGTMAPADYFSISAGPKKVLRDPSLHADVYLATAFQALGYGKKDLTMSDLELALKYQKAARVYDNESTSLAMVSGT